MITTSEIKISTYRDGQRFLSPLIGEEYYRVRHPSGITVLICPRDLATYYAVLGTGFGALDCNYTDTEGNRIILPAGVAHYLEHRMFTNPDGKDASSDFAQYGADVNAYTSYDKTAYLFSCTSGFDECLERLLYFVTHPFFSGKTVDAERPIIAEEIRMNRDDPYERCYNELLRGLYKSGAICSDICGSQESIGKITPETLESAYKTFYDPSNLTLAVCGRVTPERVIETVDRCMQGVKSAGKRFCRLYDTVPGVQSVRRDIKMQVLKPVFNIGIRNHLLDKANSNTVGREYRLLREDTVLSLLSEALFTRAGDFYSELFESGLITPGFSYGSTVLRDISFCAFSGESGKPQEVLERFGEYIEKLKREGIKRSDFERSKRVLYADYITSFDSTEDIASLLLDSAINGIGMFDYLNDIENTTYDEIIDALNTQFSEDDYVMSTVLPLE